MSQNWSDCIRSAVWALGHCYNQARYLLLHFHTLPQRHTSRFCTHTHGLIHLANSGGVLRSAPDCSTDVLFKYCRLIKYKSINDAPVKRPQRERGSAVSRMKHTRCFCWPLNNENRSLHYKETGVGYWSLYPNHNRERERRGRVKEAEGKRKHLEIQNIQKSKDYGLLPNFKPTWKMYVHEESFLPTPTTLRR